MSVSPPVAGVRAGRLGGAVELGVERVELFFQGLVVAFELIEGGLRGALFQGVAECLVFFHKQAEGLFQLAAEGFETGGAFWRPAF